MTRPDVIAAVRRFLARSPYGTNRESRIVAKLVDARTDEADVRAALRHLERAGEVSRTVGVGRQSLARRTVYTIRVMEAAE